MDARLNITVGSEEALPLLGPLVRMLPEWFPRTQNVVRMLGKVVENEWRAYAAGAPIPASGLRVQHPTGEYVRSIHGSELQVSSTGFNVETWTDSDHHRALDEGTEARDMKRNLWTSLKVRLTQKGKRYLIIPFRWGVQPRAGETAPNARGRLLPAKINRFFLAKDRETRQRLRPASHVLAKTKRRSGTGAFDVQTRQPVMVDARKYQWGHRLTKKELRAMGLDDSSVKAMAGMVRFADRGNDSKHSEYLTFRVMSENSAADSWWRPATPALRIMDSLGQLLEERGARETIHNAIRSDFRKIALAALNGEA